MTFAQFVIDLVECLAGAALLIAAAGWLAWFLARHLWDID